MKKIIIVLFLFSLVSCATLKQPAGTIGMNSEERIHYYEKQINDYQFLIDQEKKKIEDKKTK